MTIHRAVALTLLLVAAGCHSDRPREAPFPSFRMRGVFGDASSLKKTTSTDGTEATLQLPIALGGRYLATLTVPAMGSEWSWSMQLDGRATLVTHQSAGHSPDLVLYAERGPDEDPMPSVELRRFLAYADAGSDDVATWALRYALEAGVGSLKEHAQQGSGGRGSESLLRGISGGLGFASTPDSFSGWKWVGRTEGAGGNDRLDVRLGRWDGLWTDGRSRLGTQLAALRGGGGGAATKLLSLLESKGVAEAAIVDARPATMLAGSVRLPEGAAPVYVALVCPRPCAHEAAVTELFESLRASSGEALRDAVERGARQDAGQHEKDAGIVVLDTRRIAEDVMQAATAQVAPPPSSAGVPSTAPVPESPVAPAGSASASP